MRNGIACIVGFLGILATIIGITVLLTWWFDSTECRNVEKNSSPGITTDYRGIMAGCYVTENGKTVPIDRWRVVTTTE